MYVPKSKKLISIINDEDMLLDLKDDKVFKVIFNSKEGKDYLAYIISFTTKLDYNYVYNNMRLSTNKNSINNINNPTRVSDIVIENSDSKLIVEMNKTYTSSIYNKNNYYMFNFYVNLINDSTNYEVENKGWLINIDNYDLYKKNKFIYEEVLEEKTHHICILNK